MILLTFCLVIIKAHITGFAVAYEPRSFPKVEAGESKRGRPQGSLVNQQKRMVSDAVEWMRRECVFKPLIFVATSPGFVDPLKERKPIQQLTHTLRNGYNCKNYVWVRELTGNGFPHWHFVADMPSFDVVKLSLYWSSLFGQKAKNSIRLGTAPGKNGKRSFWVNSPKLAWYMSKYIGKDIGGAEPGVRRPYRSFQISQEARSLSEPVKYSSTVTTLYNGRHARLWGIQDNPPDWAVNVNFCSSRYEWKWTGHGETFVGFEKKSKIGKGSV